MTADEVDAYLAGLEEPKRSTLEDLRRSIRAAVPDAEECISYGMPAFRVGGKVVAGFAAFKNHLAYLPHSGEVLEGLGDRVSGYECTKGSLHFSIDEPLPKPRAREARPPRNVSRSLSVGKAEVPEQELVESSSEVPCLALIGKVIGSDQSEPQQGLVLDCCQFQVDSVSRPAGPKRRPHDSGRTLCLQDLGLDLVRQ